MVGGVISMEGMLFRFTVIASTSMAIIYMNFFREMTDSGAMTPVLLKSLVDQKLPALGGWALRTVEALPKDSPYPAAGYRDLYFQADGSYRWFFPRSNAAERITVFLQLARELKDRRYFDAAIHYADAMLDPIYGLYDGPDLAGKGQVWYWRDTGFYMTNYTMRVPPAMFELFDATGDQRYYDAAVLAGEALLRAQVVNGTLLEGYRPQHEVRCFEPFDFDANPDCCTNYKVNSRIGYATYAFATLYSRTGRSEYAAALEKLSYALSRYQNPDGSIPENLALAGYKPITNTVKNHFQSYILNGAAAALKVLPDVPHLAEVTRKLADYTVETIRCSWGWPYGSVDNFCSEEGSIWRSSTADISSGLSLFAEISGDFTYRQFSARLLLNTLLTAIDRPDQLDFDGALPIWGAGDVPIALGGHFHFFTLLGLLQFQYE